MNSYFEYLDSIPKLPEEIVQEVYSCIEGINIFHTPEYPNYQVFETNDKIKTFIKEYFPNLTPRIHCIKNFLPVHKDLYRSIAFNYILEQGGKNVKTLFFNDDKHLIDQIIIEKNRWHKIHTKIYHAVSNLKTIRISITVS